MQKPADDNLFDLRLTAQGISALQSTIRLIKWLFGAAIVASLLLLGITLLALYYSQKAHLRRMGLAGWYNARVHPVLTLLDVGLVIFQFYAFFRFGQLSAKAIGEGDEAKLNHSFDYLARFTRLAVVQMYLIVLLYVISFGFLIQSIIGTTR